MSSTASNYDMQRLMTGISLGTVAVTLALAAVLLSKRVSIFDIFKLNLITLAYGSMTFASSYVEEEHHFWYWCASGWLIYLATKQYVNCPAEYSRNTDLRAQKQITVEADAVSRYHTGHNTFAPQDHEALESDRAEVRGRTGHCQDISHVPQSSSVECRCTHILERCTPLVKQFSARA